MIQKFRWKFIGTSVAALLLVLLITLGGLVGISGCVTPCDRS